MAVADELKIILRAETKAAVNALRKAQRETDTTEDRFKRLASGIGKSMLAFGAAAVSVRALTSSIRESVKLAGIQEQAERGLEAALRATGDTSEESADMLKALASELQGVTTFGDEATIAAAGLFTQVSGLSAELTASSLPAVQDFAAAMGMDLQQAASLVGRSIGSTTNALTRYGIQIEEGLTGTARMEAIVGQLDDRFGGFSEALASTASGSLVQFQNAMGDLKEVGGAAILEFIQPSVEGLQSFVEKITEAAQESLNLRRTLADGGTSTDDIELVNRAISEQIIKLNEVQDAASQATARGYGSAGAEAVARETRELDRLIARRAELAEIMRNEARNAAGMTATMAAETQKYMDSLNNGISKSKMLLVKAVEEDTEAQEARARSFEDASARINATFADESAARLTALETQLIAEEEFAEKQRQMQEERVQVAQDTTEFLLQASADVLGGLFKNERAAAIANRIAASFRASINTAEAATKALTLGPILGPPAAAAVTALGVAQVAAINAQPLPAFERGGSFVTSGPQAIMVGDGQSPRERVTVEPLSGPYRGGGGNITVNVHAVAGSDKETVAAWVVEGIKRGQQRGTIGAVA